MNIENQGASYGLSLTHAPHMIIANFVIGDFGAWPGDTTTLNPYPIAGCHSASLPQFLAPNGLNQTWRGFSLKLDLGEQMQRASLTELRTAWIDNSLNPAKLAMINLSTRQRIVAAPFTQGYYPLLMPQSRGNQVQFAIAVAERNVNSMAMQEMAGVAGVFGSQVAGGYGSVLPPEVQITFTDVPMPATVWRIHDHGCQAFDCSGTIAVGGVWQDLIHTGGGAGGSFATANLFPSAYRRGFLVQNPFTAGAVLYLHFGDNGINESVFAPAIGDTVELNPGDIYQERGDDAYTGRVMVGAAAAPHPYIGKLFF